MAIDYDKIESGVRSLGGVIDNREFLRSFLEAYNFPKTTFARIDWPSARTNIGVYIQNKIFFIDTNSPNLFTDFDIIKKNGLNKIHADFLLLVNKTELLACDLHTLDVISTDKVNLYKNIEFFFQLIGIKTSAINQTNESVDIKVAEKFARLYNEVILNNQGNEDLASELIFRLLFCCFADSANCLGGENLFSLIATYTEIDGSDCPKFLNDLFCALSSEKRNNLPSIFAKINFIDKRLSTFGTIDFLIAKDARLIILDLLQYDWKTVTPEILGALIQSIVVPSSKIICGNYTATANIQKLIGPLYMNELYLALDNAQKDATQLLLLLRRIQSISIVDPSCGTGNFLLVAYKELHKISELICDRLIELGMEFESSSFFSSNQFFGIEESNFSCKISRIGFLFSVYQQTASVKVALESFFSANIIHGDPLRVDWNSVCKANTGEIYIIGNPSYKGANKQTPTQKQNLERVFSDYKGCKNLDYAACWFMIAARYLKNHRGGFAFVTTNSLTQGNQVQRLWPKLFNIGYYIQFAHKSFKWKNDTRNRTAVTVVIIGLLHNDAQRHNCELFLSYITREPHNISPYLVSGNAIIGERTTSISGLPDMVKGNMPYDSGYLLLSPQEKFNLLEQSPSAEKYLRRVVGSDEFINGKERWCLWIHDDEADKALQFPGINERVESVKASRLSNSDTNVRKIATRSYQFRDIKETHGLSLVVPAVYSENYLYAPIGFMFKDTIATNLVSVIYDCEPWIFGIIASKMHNVWIGTVCGKLEERIRYSLKLGYNTFPISKLNSEQKKLINKCVFNVIRAREAHSGDTLATLYHKERMPDDLRLAHSMLDEVIDKCYRNEPFVSDEERLTVLFDLYEKMEG